MAKRALKRAFVITLIATMVFAPATSAAYPEAPQCWDRYNQRENPDCNGDTPPGQLPGSGGGAPQGGGLLGTIGHVLGGIL